MSETVDPLLSADRVAEAYDVSVKTVRRWAVAGLIPAAVRRPNGAPAWRKSEIVQHIRSLERAELREMAT